MAEELDIDLRCISRMERQPKIRFNTADRIVTRLKGWDAWHWDPVLNEIYVNAVG